MEKICFVPTESMKFETIQHDANYLDYKLKLEFPPACLEHDFSTFFKRAGLSCEETMRPERPAAPFDVDR